MVFKYILNFKSYFLSFAERLGSDPNPINRTICLAGSPVSSTVALSNNLLVYHVNQYEDSMDTPFVCLYQPKHQRVIFKLFPSTIKLKYIYFATSIFVALPDFHCVHDCYIGSNMYFWFFKLFPSTIGEL